MSTDGTEVGLQTMQQKMNLLDGIKIPPGAANKFNVFQSGKKKKSWENLSFVQRKENQVDQY